MTVEFISWRKRQIALLVVSAVVLLLIFELSSADVIISNHFYDVSRKLFVLKDDALVERYLHTGLKQFMMVMGCLSILFFGSWAVRQRILPLRHFAMGASAIFLIPLAIVALKWATHRACPWSLDMYGGTIPYTSLLAHALGTASYENGQCFPAGHSSGGFMWLGWGLALGTISFKWSRFFLMTGWVSGLAMGFVRVMQGAHFVSHVLWAGWFAWALTLVLGFAFQIEPMHAPQAQRR